ncbi:Response regulator receiver domain-containing protein [Cohaesibacter sp. ES.047]|uniref:response regulator n=1 Tax=Cohaesibacter sp. ES.047 TaxID=1798205 RepID=UPI000BB90B46|nr:response regulator [Cohaesibacter sp. ES.047]SNY90809.1 Response regulator receiver domain-containing protein [Cohaesibacter sp. ES.047]
MARILLTEDDDGVRMFVQRALMIDGHDVTTAEDGTDALEMLERCDDAFDLLLTDIKMPEMDGIELALSAAKDWPEMTILMMTGYADQRERCDNLNAIVHDVVSKPFSLTEIRGAVRDALRGEESGEPTSMAHAMYG